MTCSGDAESAFVMSRRLCAGGACARVSWIQPRTVEVRIVILLGDTESL